MNTMKSKKIILILILIVVLSALVACEETAPAAVKPLSPTGLKVESGRLVWNAVEGADGYLVSYNGEVYAPESNFYVLPDELFGETTFTVTAVKSGRSSDKAELKTFVPSRLKAPKNLRQEDNVIRWDAVASAEYYIVRINGEEYRADSNEYVIEEGVKGSVSVLAAGNLQGTILSSEYSEELVLKTVLAVPDGIYYYGGFIKWNAVENADGYIVTINGSETRVTKNEFSVKYLYCGDTDVKVKAVSDDAGVYPSAEKSQRLYIEKFALETPRNLTIAGNIVTFDAVVGATAYEIYFDGELYETTTAASCTVPETSVSYVQVRAISDTADGSALSEKVVFDYISITTEEELVAMKEYGCYKLESDIVMTSERIPVTFCGALDGNGHTISNVVIVSDKAKVGFFSRLENATIKDLKIKGSISVNTLEAGAAVGSVAGECCGSTVKNCEIDFSINVTTGNGIGVVGGAVGVFENSSAEKVVFKGNIETHNAVTGGFIGKAKDPVEINYVKNCRVEATVNAIGGEQAACGGFIGYFTDNCLEISACYADCTVTGPSYVGGFVGYMGSGRISDCYSKGSVAATNEELCHVGGFIGRLEGYNNGVTRCIAMAQVETQATGAYTLVGGFVGRTVGGNYNSAVYEDCFYDSTVNDMDRIGSGRGDGILAKSTEELKTASAFDRYDSSVWDICDGQLPSLK